MNWNLNDILPANKFSSLSRQIIRQLTTIKKMWRAINYKTSARDFAKFINLQENLTEKISRLYNLPHLMESSDERSAKAKLLKEKADDLYLKVSNELRPISHWLKGKDIKGKKRLDDQNAKRLFAAVPDLRYVLNHDRELAQYTLDELPERIIAEKDAYGLNVLNSLRDFMESEFVYLFKKDGTRKPEKITQSELMFYAKSASAGERRRAYLALFQKHKENLQKFFMIYSAAVKNWAGEAKLRGYPSPIAMRNRANHLPDAVIETLLKVCSKNKSVFQKFFRWKAREMGVKRLSRFDLYAPLRGLDKKIDFAEAVRLTRQTFGEFSPAFAEKAERVVKERHIDSHPRSGKHSGAFCATVAPSITPYVLMNFTGSIRDVSTLAHELGHAAHSLYASRHNASSQHANLPLAETASTLGETILFEKLLAREKNPAIKKAMLAEKIADSYAAIIRQNYFVKFEMMAHELIPTGITPEKLSGLWLKTLKEQFGDSVAIHPIFKYEWAYIPHIVHTPFYCYAYNFGELLSLSLFKRYKDEGRSFALKIEKILAYGGSEDPDKILREIGVDMSDSRFWENAFQIIRGWQKELDRLAY